MGTPRRYQIRMAIVCGVTVLCLFLFIPSQESLALDAFLLLTQGGGIYTPDVYPPTLIFGSLPFLVFCYLFADFLDYDLGRAAVYIFTRKEERSQWVMRKIALLVLSASLVSTAVFVTLTGIHLLLHTEEEVLVALRLALGFLVPLVTLNTLYTAVMVILINLLSLRLSALWSFCVVAFLHLLSLLVCVALPEGMRDSAVHIFPAAQGIFVWHEVSAFVDSNTIKLLNRSIVEGFSLLYSFVYLIAVGVIEVLIARCLIKRIDLIQ